MTVMTDVRGIHDCLDDFDAKYFLMTSTSLMALTTGMSMTAMMTVIM